MELAIYGFALILVLSFAGIPLAYSTLVVAVGGYWIARGSLDAAVLMAGLQLFEFSTNFNLSVVPVFILMGALIQKANISDELYEAGYAWVGPAPWRLGNDDRVVVRRFLGRVRQLVGDRRDDVQSRHAADAQIQI